MRRRRLPELHAALLLACELGEMVLADDLQHGEDAPSPPDGFVRKHADGTLEPGLVLRYGGRELLVLVRQRGSNEPVGERFALGEKDTEKVALSLLRGLASG